ncbi:hypothetical protein [Bradyrhizobium diazoefficiens]
MAKGTAPGADQDWWTLWPGLFRKELAAFSRLEITPRIVHKQNGVLILEADWPVQGQTEPMLLRIGYSPLHPFFRPAVAAPNATFERHQNPLSHELCLLTQEAGQWDSNQLVAGFIQERLEHLLRALKARKDGRWGDAAKLEEQAADPLMPYFLGTSEEDSVILFDGQAGLPRGTVWVDGSGLLLSFQSNRCCVRGRPAATEDEYRGGGREAVRISDGVARRSGSHRSVGQVHSPRDHRCTRIAPACRRGIRASGSDAAGQRAEGQ